MIARYTLPVMGRIWSDQNRFQQWLEVELAASEALAELGEVPADAARLLREHATFDVDRIHEIEKEVKHDVVAFTPTVSETMAAKGHAEASRWLHFGLTSNDVVDTAQGLLLKQASGIILHQLRALREVLKRRAVEPRFHIAGERDTARFVVDAVGDGRAVVVVRRDFFDGQASLPGSFADDFLLRRSKSDGQIGGVDGFDQRFSDTRKSRPDRRARG